MRLLAYILFYPTLWWNVLLCRVFHWRRWWDRIDDGLLLGALPFEKDVPQLQALGVGAVLNVCGEAAGPVEAYRRAGIEQLRLAAVDFLPPSLEVVREGVEFMRRQVCAGRKVYVHCKAGRGRSATIALCYLITKGLTSEEAQRILLQKRPQVMPALYKRAVVAAFAAEARREPLCLNNQGG
jgi:atypical dual specificity phosphatase